jgi:hypothetical protein
MELILINRSAADLKQQLDFLIKREFFVKYFGYKKIGIYFICATLAVLALLILTDSNDLVTLKVLSICFAAVAWLVGLGILLMIIIKRQKRLIWRNAAIKSILVNEFIAQMAFDEEKLIFITETYKTEVKWDYYKFYAEYKNSIFFIPEKNLYEALYFSPGDIGQANFNQLKNIAKMRLKLLEEKYRKYI